MVAAARSPSVRSYLSLSLTLTRSLSLSLAFSHSVSLSARANKPPNAADDDDDDDGDDDDDVVRGRRGGGGRGRGEGGVTRSLVLGRSARVPELVLKKRTGVPAVTVECSRAVFVHQKSIRKRRTGCSTSPPPCRVVCVLRRTRVVCVWGEGVGHRFDGKE